MDVYKEKRSKAQTLFMVSGCGCLFFALIPALIYRIAHTGVFALFLSGLFFVWAALFWPGLSCFLRRAITALIALALIPALALSAMMARQAWFNAPPSGRSLPVVILGGKVNGYSPSLMLARRLNAAAAYLMEHRDALCVVSGGQGSDEDFPEAQVMAAYLEGIGVASAKILQESRSTSTQENIAFSLEFLRLEGLDAQPLEVAIATDAFHQLRAGVFASAMQVRAYSLPSETPWGLIPSYWVRELIALPVAWLNTVIT